MSVGTRRGFSASAAMLAGLMMYSPVGFPGVVAPAYAQAPAAQPQGPIDFDAALEGYGHWVQHPRLGDVWVPDNVPQGWQPYRIGRWVYTDDWGWYWDSAEDFGWVTYHYGRWYLDRELGWVWIPDDEWGPAWVNWRQGDDFVGWAPTPPDEFIEDDDDPDMYAFVPAGELLAPDVYTVFIPYERRRDYYHRSTLVNRSIYFADRRGAVNPGIPPAFIARASGRPFHSSHVAPIVLAGTVGVAGAVILREGFRDQSRTRITVRETTRVVQPSERFQRLPGLNKGERGRLGTNAPLAAQGGKAVLNIETQVNTRGQRRFAPTSPTSPQIDRKQIEQKNEQRSIEQKKIEFDRKKMESKQFDKNEQQNLQRQRELEKKKNVERNIQEKNLQQQRNLQQQKIERRDVERKNFEQKNLQQQQQQQNLRQQQQQRSIQQNNQPQIRRQENIRPNNPPAPQQHSAPQNTQRRNDNKDRQN